jgi:hypothetical protein
LARFWRAETAWVERSGVPGMSGNHVRCYPRDSPGETTRIPRAQVATWRHDPLSAKRTLQVIRVSDDDADQPPVLVVEHLPEQAGSAKTEAAETRGLRWKPFSVLGPQHSPAHSPADPRSRGDPGKGEQHSEHQADEKRRHRYGLEERRGFRPPPGPRA